MLAKIFIFKGDFCTFSKFLIEISRDFCDLSLNVFFLSSKIAVPHKIFIKILTHNPNPTPNP
jgi:hypothetical protein